MKAKIFFTIMVISAFTIKANAQLAKNLSVGLDAGAYVYQGDLVPAGFGALNSSSLGISLYAQKPFSNYLSVRLQFAAARLQANESKYNTPAYRQQRNFSFTTPLKEISGLLVWNIAGSNYTNFGIQPYIFTGIGVSFINTTADSSRINRDYFKNSNIDTLLAADKAHGTPGSLPVIPLGIGVDIPISERLALNAEANYRFAFTDYIDGFSRSANPNLDDHYYSLSVGLKYRFTGGGSSGKGAVDCPKYLY
ncbi:DUF6089 family protein [Ferruginibacter albus]|uniref:DUF6089 family protein n=1 Tax=Ferruginibacter albus TaxID=2875540 RepID=UPI001CC7CB76|nr:DUF6089 family protein [Ferruginibacter albus]UAY52568.1 DUF6089 family protein [Ferruginibacter albus]